MDRAHQIAQAGEPAAKLEAKGVLLLGVQGAELWARSIERHARRVDVPFMRDQAAGRPATVGRPMDSMASQSSVTSTTYPRLATSLAQARFS